jgi:hypothetical protein
VVVGSNPTTLTNFIGVKAPPLTKKRPGFSNMRNSDGSFLSGARKIPWKGENLNYTGPVRQYQRLREKSWEGGREDDNSCNVLVIINAYGISTPVGGIPDSLPQSIPATLGSGFLVMFPDKKKRSPNL